MTLKTGVYAIRNKANGKRYVGGAYKSLEARRRKHWQDLRSNQHFNPYLQNAWHKYGEGSFEFVVLERCPGEACGEREQYWINELKATDKQHGYNICPVTGSRLGVDEDGRHREKRARAGRTPKRKREDGYRWPEESRIAWSKKQKGKKLSDDHKRKITESTKAAHATQEVKDRVSAAQLKRWAECSPEERSKRLEKLAEAVETARQPEVRNRAAVNIRKALANRSPEEIALWKLRMSIAAKKRVRKKVLA